MKSKAEKFAEKCKEGGGSLNRPCCVVGHEYDRMVVGAEVGISGSCLLHSLCLSAEDALQLADWIYETFGKPGEAPDG